MSRQPRRKKKEASTAAAVGASTSQGQVATAPFQYSFENEPRADASMDVPVWLFILLFILIYWGMLHLDRHAGGFNEMVYGPYVSYRQLAEMQPRSGAEMLFARGESVYAVVCSACHQPSGLGSGPNPPLAGSEWVTGSSGRLIRIPLHGLTGPIEVSGQTYNASMPGFGNMPPLDDDENMAAVLTYIRQSWGNQASAITPEQVSAVRAETAGRTAPWTAGELLNLPED
jgi:mono/diheme cytochrome c family protein